MLSMHFTTQFLAFIFSLFKSWAQFTDGLFLI